MNCHLNRKNATTICALAAWLLLLVASGSVNAQSPAKDQWLVFNNGETLQGKISFADGRYSVVTATGSRIIVPKDRTNFVADSIEDIYWEKWSRVDPLDAKSHIGLFRWCLKNGLLDKAQKQINLVSKIDDLEGQAAHLLSMAQELELMVEQIEKQELLAQQQKSRDELEIRNLPRFPATENAGFAAAPRIPSAPIDAEGRLVRKLAPAAKTVNTENKIGLVDFEEEVEPLTRNKPARVNNTQLDRETRLMPDGTVSFYKKHLEQKLIANCASCHNTRSVSMPLSQRSFGQTIPRRMSQQNLHFLMEQIDRSNPLASPLLTMATTAHGEQKTASFRSGDPYLFDLKKWSIAVSHDPSKWLMQLAQESARKPQAAVKETAADAIAESIDVNLEIAPEKSAATKVEAIEVPDENADPYDPAAFNRR